MKTILLTLAMAAAVLGARAQEYQSQTIVRAPGYEQIKYEDGSTTTTTWHVSNVTGEITNLDTVRTHAAVEAPQLTLAPRPVYVNTDLHANFQYPHQNPRVQVTAAPAVTVVPAERVPTTTENDRKAAIERAKVEAAQHARNVKAARGFKNGE